MLALAGEVADGVLALLYPPEHYPVARAQVARGADEGGPLGRGGRHPRLRLGLGRRGPPSAAKAALAAKLAFYGRGFAPYLLERAGLAREDFAPAAAAQRRGDMDEAAGLITPAMLRLGIAGTPDEVVDRCSGAPRTTGPPICRSGRLWALTRCAAVAAPRAQVIPPLAPGRPRSAGQSRYRRRGMELWDLRVTVESIEGRRCAAWP